MPSQTAMVDLAEATPVQQVFHNQTPVGNGLCIDRPPSFELPSCSPHRSPVRKVQGLRWFLTSFGVFSANFLYGLDNTIVAVIQPDISETFNNVDQLGWLGVGFCLGATSMILPLGRAYDMFNKKLTYLACLVMFAAASALCGAASSMNVMIVARVWAGAGGAGMYLGTLNIFNSLCLPAEQPLFMGLIALVYGIGTIAGPIVGGAIADSSAGWRWAFYLNLFVIGAESPVFLWCLPSLPAQTKRPLRDKLKDMDCLGVIISIGIYVTFTLGLSMVDRNWAWSDPRSICMLILCVLLVAIMVLCWYFSVLVCPEHRLFPSEYLKDARMVALYIMTAAIGASQFIAVYYIPLYFSFVRGDSGVQAAIRLLPYVLCYIGGVMACSLLIRKTGFYPLWYFVSGVCTTVGGALWYSVTRETSASDIYGFSVVLGLGIMAAQAAYIVGPDLVAAEKVTTMIQFFNAAQGQGYLAGLSVASIIFQSLAFQRLEVVLTPEGYSTSDIHSAVAGARSEVLQQVDDATRTLCVDIIVESMSNVWIMVIAGGSLIVVGSCIILGRSLIRRS